MGRLGRFQIVAAVFIFVMLLAVTGIVGTVELMEPIAESGEAPLISMGEVSRGAVAAVVAAIVVFTLIFLRGGMLLVSASDEIDAVVSTDSLDQHHLEAALQRLRSYFMLEALVMVALAAAIYAATIAGWGL